MKAISLADVPRIKVDAQGAKDTYKQLVISARDGSPSFSVRVFTIEPGGHTPYHQHPFEHLNYIIAGQGAIVTSTGERLPVKAGDFALVLPDETHQYRNALPDTPLVVICAVPKEYE